MKSTTTQAHRASLDGVRALAIFGVILVHAGFPGARSGWIGVDIFFVLSGFLITTLLSMEIAATRRIDWPAFIVRRSLRLMPAYFLYAGLMTLAIWAWPGSVRSEEGGWSATGLTVALWTYILNFVPQGGIWNGQEALVHLWSLAVEQQYYVVWPLMLSLLIHRRHVVGGVALVFAVGCALMFILWPAGLYKDHMLWTRGFSLISASAVALLAARDAEFLARPAWGRPVDIVGAVGLLALFALAYLPGWSENGVRTVLLPVLVPVFAVWVARLWYVPSAGLMRSLLQHRWLVYMGRVSYGIYLYHELLRMTVWNVSRPLMAGWPPAIGFVVRFVLFVAVSIGVAAASYELFEKRFMRLASRFRPPRAAAP